MRLGVHLTEKKQDMNPLLVTLFQNATLLLAMMVVFDLVTSRKAVPGEWRHQVFTGVILGGLTIGLMLASFRLETGIIFDTRSVLLSLSGLFFGPITTVTAMAMAAASRFWQGGTGVWAGIWVILTTGGMGILWRHYRQERLADISLRELYGFGMVVHLVMLALMLTLPRADAWRVLSAISLPVLLVYPLATVVLGWLLAGRLQREKTLEAMAASEARYRSLFEATNVGKSVTLPTGEIHVNRAFCDMLGYDPEELRGKNWQELTPAEDVPESERCIASLLDGREDSTRFEKRYIRKDGGIVWADVSVTLIRDSRTQPIHFITTVVDITERKQHEAQIEHLNRVLRAIRDVNQLIIHEEDPESLLARSCEILVSTRGYRSVWAVLDSEDGAAQTVAESGIGDDFAPVREAIAQGDWPDCCWQARERPDGIAPIHDTDRNCKDCTLAHTCRDTAALAGALRHGRRDYGSLVVALPAGLADDPEEQSLFRELVDDVAYALRSMDLARKRKKAEEALRSSEEHFRLVVENAPDAIFVQTEYLFTYLNPAAVRCFGAESADQLLGQPVMDRFEPRFHDLVRERIRQLNDEKTAVPMLKQTYLKMDGSPFHVEVAAVPIHWQGQDGALVFFRDVTEREALEEQFRQAQKLVSVGRLAGGVAHDFNNILTTIMGTAEFMLGDVPADDPLRDDIQEIKAAGERATSLTRQLLAFSRKQVLQLEVINLNDTIQNMTKMLRRMIPEDIEVQTALAEDLDQVEADEGQIEQVIMNLAINARDAMPAGGRMSIETANVDLDETYAQSHVSVRPGSFVMLSVSDTGMGMSKEVQEQVFEPFFTTKDQGKGTGLGLSTVYGIVKQSNGSIWVYSEPDKGTTIKIYLPRVETSRPQAMSREKDVPDLTGTETVLVVEDDAQVRSLAVKSLKGYGYTVLTAGNGAEALKVAGQSPDPIHLVLTDVIMPGMNGQEMAEQLKAARPEMQVLYMSGYTDNAIVHHGVLDPGVAFIGKPFTPAALGRKVREVLDS